MKQAFKLASAVLLMGLATLAVPARAVSEADLLPVDQAFALSAKAVSRGQVEFTWKIAPGYYLYRHRFGVQPTDSSFKFKPLQLPAGKKHNDEFFGAVETYRQSVTATLTGAAAGGVGEVSFRIKYQGCADLGVCYPPQTRTLTVALPADAAASSRATDTTAGGSFVARATDPAGGGLAVLRGPGGADLLGSTDALPAEQAFRVEAIADSPSELLVRMTPAPGYYLYRDKTSFRLLDAAGTALAAPRFPAGKPYRDEHFGEVTVYFDQVEVPVPVLRQDTTAHTVTLEASFQGCLTDGICYPPMTRLISVTLPAGAGAVGEAAAGPAKTGAGAPVKTAVAGLADTASLGSALNGFWVSLLLALVGFQSGSFSF